MNSWPDEIATVSGSMLDAEARSGFVITIRKGERFFLNGAVVEAVNRSQIKLLNDANFLLDNHIIQEKEATTPLRQLYFVAQAMLINPAESKRIGSLFHVMASNFANNVCAPQLVNSVEAASEYVNIDKPFLAMRALRRSFAIEDLILAESDRS